MACDSGNDCCTLQSSRLLFNLNVPTKCCPCFAFQNIGLKDIKLKDLAIMQVYTTFINPYLKLCFLLHLLSFTVRKYLEVACPVKQK